MITTTAYGITFVLGDAEVIDDAEARAFAEAVEARRAAEAEALAADMAAWEAFEKADKTTLWNRLLGAAA